jgi:hypothetical protein
VTVFEDDHTAAVVLYIHTGTRYYSRVRSYTNRLGIGPSGRHIIMEQCSLAVLVPTIPK